MYPRIVEIGPITLYSYGAMVALGALAAGTDDGLSAEEVDLAVLDGDGFDALDRDRREDAIADAGLAQAS